MRLLVTGSMGQLGSEIKDLSINYDCIEFFFKDLPELDICDPEALEKFINRNQINAVINCAAYTNVDKAEDNIKMANQVNKKGVINIINALNITGGKLIHISTDYVYNGNNLVPYKETDMVDPLGVYGKSKRAGELAVIDSKIDAIIIRTSWLYSAHGSNFVKTMLKLGNDREKIGVVIDQLGTPTNASDLAKACLEILKSRINKKISSLGCLYHYSNEGVASWYDFSVAIMELGDVDCKINPIKTTDYPTLAKRPKYSVLDKSKIKTDFKIEIPYWRDSLKDCITKIKLDS